MASKVSDLRMDEIGFGGLRLMQDPESFCYGVDAVLLACFLDPREQPQVIADLGTGNGILPILLSHKTQARQIIGIELQKEAADLARENARLNGLEARIRILHRDIKEVFEEAELEPGSCDTVVSNPPYMKAAHGVPNVSTAKRIARHETTAGLPDFFQTAASLLRPLGSFYLIHRPERLVDLLTCAREYRLEPKRIRLVSPSPSKSPNLVLIHTIKGGRPGLRFLDPLSVYDGKGAYTQELLELYERT